MKLLRPLHNSLFRNIIVPRWVMHFVFAFGFSIGTTFGLYYLSNSAFISDIFATDTPWTQTDWSGGTTSGTVNATVTTFESSSNINTSTSGQFSLTQDYYKATMKGTQVSGGSTNFNVGAATALQYNTSQALDDDYFSYDGGSPTRLTVDQDGDYFISLTMDIFSNGGEDASYRNGISAEIWVNGVKVDVGRGAGSYIRNYSAHNESTVNLTAFLNDLSANDYVEIYVIRTTDNTDHAVTGPFTLYAEYVAASETVFAATATRTVASTNLNSSASALQWTEVQKDSGFTHDDVIDSHEITLDAAGDYFVTINVPYGSTTQRANVQGRVLLDGVEVDGGQFKQGYIRNASSHADASGHWVGVVRASSANQVLTITTEQEGAAGTVTVDGEKATIFVQKLPSTGVYLAEATQAGSANEWNPSSERSINWATDEIIDTDVYTHDTSTNNYEVTVDLAGDYLLGFNAAFSSSAQRATPSIEVKVNGADVSGAVSQSSYIRASSGHDESSTMLYIPLIGLSANDVITLTVEEDGVTGATNDTTEALLFLWRKSYSTSGTLTSNILDAETPSDWGTITFNTSGTGSVSMKVRTDSNSDMSGATAWASCDAVSSGSDLTANNCVTDTDQYLQYQVTLTGNGSSTPVFEDLSIAFSSSDQVVPTTNATSIAITGIDDGAWTNTEPTISWTAGADNIGGVGLEGYCISLDEVDAGQSSSGLDPASTSGTVMAGLSDGVDSDACDFIATGTSVDLSAISGLTLTSGKQYYFSIKAVDAAGNIWTGAAENYQDLVSFKYDAVKPSNPSFISLPSDFISTKSATITWPTSGGNQAADTHSGVAGLQYRIGSGGTWYGDNHSGDQDADDLLTNDGAYTTDPTVDYDNIEEGNNLIYFRTWDNAGNVSTSYTSGVLKVNSTAPSAPESLAVSPDDSTTNSYAFSWSAPSTYTGSVDNITYCYTVNALPTSANCSFTSAGQTSLSAGAYATLPGANRLYLVAKDEAGNINYDTYASIEFTYSGSAPGIPSSAEVADISVKATESWKLVMTWEEPSDVGAGVANYQVYRSTTDTTCSASISSFTEVGSTSGLSYTDTGLTQQSYYYCVRACDNANNCGSYSSTVSGYPDGKFTTAADLTSGPTASGITTKRATLSWTTDRTSDSKIAYGTSSGSYNNEEVSSSDQVTSHTINLTNLNAGTTYYYVAKWTDEDGNTGISEEQTFSTEPAPTVKDVEVLSIGVDSAIVKFTATGATKAKINYGPTTTFGGLSEISTSTNETTYTVQLSGLEDDTKYFYKIDTLDSEDEVYAGTILFFTTLPRPRIANVRIQELKQAANPTVLVTWESNTDISSIVTYYPEGNPGAARDEVDVTRIAGNHRMLIRDLVPNTNYTMLVKGVDKVGNEAVSDAQRFTTATDTRPPLVSNLIVEGNVNVQVADQTDQTVQLIVSWDTDEPATSQVEFGEGTGTSYAQQTQEDKNLTLNHVVIISGLTPSKVYHLRAISRDSIGNIGKSIDTVTIAPKTTDDALGLVLSNLRETFGFLDSVLGN